MCKNDLVEKIHNAKRSHLKWVKRVKHLLEQVLVADEMITLDPRESEFGHWLYKDAYKCHHTPFFAETLNLIEKEHIHLHQIYFEIYRIYFVETKRKNFKAVLLGKRKKISNEQWVEAKDHYYELIEVSRKLLIQVNNLERKVRMSNDQVIEKCLVA